MRGHFASVWEGLEDDIDDTRQVWSIFLHLYVTHPIYMYKWRAVAAKKMKAKGASQK